MDDSASKLDSQSGFPASYDSRRQPQAVPVFIHSLIQGEAVMFVGLMNAVGWVAELIRLFIDQIPA